MYQVSHCLIGMLRYRTLYHHWHPESSSRAEGEMLIAACRNWHSKLENQFLTEEGKNGKHPLKIKFSPFPYQFKCDRIKEIGYTCSPSPVNSIYNLKINVYLKKLKFTCWNPTESFCCPAPFSHSMHWKLHGFLSQGTLAQQLVLRSTAARAGATGFYTGSAVRTGRWAGVSQQPLFSLNRPALTHTQPIRVSNLQQSCTMPLSSMLLREN